MTEVNLKTIASIKFHPERPSNWIAYPDRSINKKWYEMTISDFFNKTLLGKKATFDIPRGWYDISYEDYISHYLYSYYNDINSYINSGYHISVSHLEPSIFQLLRKHPTLKYVTGEGIINHKSCIHIKLTNNELFVEFFDTNENALKRIQELKTDSNFIKILE